MSTLSAIATFALLEQQRAEVARIKQLFAKRNSLRAVCRTDEQLLLDAYAQRTACVNAYVELALASELSLVPTKLPATKRADIRAYEEHKAIRSAYLPS